MAVLPEGNYKNNDISYVHFILPMERQNRTEN